MTLTEVPLIEAGVIREASEKNIFPLNISLITEDEFKNYFPSLEYYRALVYALYTDDGKPKKVVSAKSENHIEAKYVIATNPDLSSHFSLESRSIPKDIIEGLTNYSNIAGFFRIEHGVTSEKDLPIEAMILLDWNGWPKNTNIAYCSQFSPNHLLPRKYRLGLLRDLFETASEYIEKIGCNDQMYVILNNTTLEFVHDSEIETCNIPGPVLNWENETARDIFTTFPKYWMTKPPPQLYRFIPFSSS